ncbi:MAG: sarcosine oxidase subunit delta [Pseudomonadota bacterium]
MLLLTCPVCGIEGEDADFLCGGEAHLVRPQSHDPDNVSDTLLRDSLYLRKNPKGLHLEQWQCVRGCGKWFNAARDTVTQNFVGFYLIGDKPPRAARPKADAKGENLSSGKRGAAS